MLLGAWAKPPSAGKILDIGTGCGVLALMQAQKSTAIIDAIDMDEQSVEEAAKNFLRSPWATRLVAHHKKLQAFESKEPFDYIITNPPFFERALQSPNPRRNVARHAAGLPPHELIAHVVRLLKPDGRFSVILPFIESRKFEDLCATSRLFTQRRSAVSTTPSVGPKRILLEFVRDTNTQPLENVLTITDANGKFTQEYLSLTAPFHNF